VNYAWVKTFADAKEAGLNPMGFVADSQVWVLRAGIAAGVMKKAGQPVNNIIDSSGRVIDMNDVVDSYDRPSPPTPPSAAC